MGEVKVSIEAFGEKSLTKIFNASDLNGQTVRSVIESMVRENWNGKDITVSNAIASEMDASGKYGVSQRLGGNDIPLRYEPVSLRDPIDKYEIEGLEEIPVVSLAVSGHHVVGY